VASLFDLALLQGREPSPASQRAISQAYPAPTCSMQDIVDAAEQMTTALRGVAGTLEDVAGLGGPAIIHLSEPDHFVVLARLSSEWAQVIDSGSVLAVLREELEQRYSGHALVLADPPPADAGRAQVAAFHHAFGVSGVGQTVEHTFTVSNTGNRPLMVEPDSCKSCGAPEVTVAEEVLASGGSTAVTVKFTISSSGNVLKVAKLRTDDPRAALVYLTLQGSVPHDVQVQPARLFVSAGKSAAPPLSLSVSGPADMQLTEAGCERGLFAAEIGAPTTDENGKQTWPVTLTLRPQDFVGRVEDTLTVRTTHPERPLITVPISGEVRGDLVLSPSQVFFGFVGPGAQREQTVTVRSRSGGVFALTGATLDSPGVRVSEPVRAEEGSWSVTISLAADRAGVVDTTLSVTTDVPGEGTLHIPVYVHVTAAP
jgi:hypothetical protein